ncbi:MAG: biotin--[acetyl-CoA-carboxylase] ligase [Rhodoferax sp.]|nr:biotin--[acetyl-CoA-carboxylase] ligase [Rhodoferax sp.]
MSMRWPAEAIWEEAVALYPAFSVEILPQVDSTNSELMRRARAGQTDPVLLVAERQIAGRGRLGRDWNSDRQGQGGTLTFSLGLPLQPQDWSGLSLAVGLSVVDSLHPDLQLKWPNDVWWRGRKLAGILTETASAGALRYAVMGVGINIAPQAADGLRTPPAALQELLPDAQAPAVLQRVVGPLLRAVRAFEAQGFAPLRERFQARDLLRGQAVVCTDGTEGIAQGVDPSGALVVDTPARRVCIHSAEVSVRPAVCAAGG